MGGGAIIGREWIVLVRRRAVYGDRFVGLGCGLAAVAGWIGWWGWRGGDRSSIVAVGWLGLSSFGLLTATQFALLLGTLLPQTAAAIAGERDRTRLDDLLTTRLSALEIVLGVVGSALARWASGLAAVVPVVVLLWRFGGVDPRLVLLVGAGLSSTAFAMAALAVTVSIHSRTARSAVAWTVALTLWWLFVPGVIVLLKPRLWPSGPSWVVSAAVGWLSTSPTGAVLSLRGVAPGGGLIPSIGRMIAWEMAGGLLLLGWSVWRLRPASRSIADDEVRIVGLRLARAQRRHHRRPPCGDDPVLWNTIHSNRSAGRAALALGWLLGLSWWAGLVATAFCFAQPAFRELADRGYRASPEAFAMPEGSPFARMLVARLSRTAGAALVVAGQARLEFNLALRQFSALFAGFLGLAVAAAVAESVWMERDRETWLGLLATPLTGGEIVRGKLLGVLVRMRVGLVVLVGIWTLGLAAGAVHPLGYLAALVTTAATTGCYAALGFHVSLTAKDRQSATNLNLILPFILSLLAVAVAIPSAGSLLLAAPSSPFLTFTSLLTYEDVATLWRAGPMPMFAGPTSYQPGLSARWAAAVWLLGTSAHAATAFVALRAVGRRFDAMVGRPVRSIRPEPDGPPSPPK